MLDFLRRGSKSWAAKAILIAIAASFLIGFGILPTIRKIGGLDETTIATVDGDRVSVTEYERQIHRTREAYRQRQVPEEILAQLDIEQSVLTGLIQKRILLRAARRMGIAVPDSAVVLAIRDDKRFHEGGGFSRERYLYWCSAQGLQPAAYEEEVREALVLRFLEDLVSTSGHVAAAEVKEWMRLRADHVSIDAIAFTPASFLQKDEPIPEADAKAYFEEHKAEFRMPVRVGIEYVTLPDSAMEEDVSVTDEDVLADWKPRKAKVKRILLKVPPGASAEQEVEVRRRAEDLAARIHDGADFGRTAGEVSEDEKTRDEGGEMGWIARGEMDPRLDKAVFEAKAGSLVGPVRGPGGFYVLRVEAFEPAFEPETIRARLRAERIEKAGVARAKDLRLDITSKTDLEAFAREKGLLYGKADRVPTDGTGEAAGSRALAEAAADLKAEGDTGAPVRVKDGFAIPRLTGRQPEREKTFEEARPVVDAAIRAARAKERAKGKAEEALALSKQGKPAAEAAKATGGEVVTTDPFHRLGGSIPKIGMSQEMVPAAFVLTEEAPVADRVFEAGGKLYVIRLRSRTSNEPDLTDPQGRTDYDRIVKSLLTERQSERFQDWIEALTRSSAIRLNEDLLQRYAKKPETEPRG